MTKIKMINLGLVVVMIVALGITTLQARSGSSCFSKGAGTEANKNKCVVDKEKCEQGQAILDISGMVCNNCVNTIHAVLKKNEGVTTCSVSLEKKEARVCFQKNKVSVKSLVQQIEKAGFKAKLAKTVLSEVKS